jgi:hypothetical protein
VAVSRYEAEQGQTVRLGIKFELPTGDLYDPDSIGDVQILDENSVLITTIAAASIVKMAVGVYYVDWAIPLAEPLGKHYDLWSYVPTAGHAGTTAKLEFIVLAAGTFAPADYYLSVSEARANCLPDCPLTDAEIQRLIRIAMAIIDRICHQHFLPVVENRDFDGSGYFYLECNGPWLELHSITNLDDPSATYDVSDFRRRGTWILHKDGRAWPFNQMEPPTGEAAVSYCAGTGAIFPRGWKNIRVNATWGLYSDCPEPIQQATCLLLMYAAKWGTTTAPMFANFSNESVDGYDYQLREVFDRVAVHHETGLPDVDGNLANYLRKQFGGHVF